MKSSINMKETDYEVTERRVYLEYVKGFKYDIAALKNIESEILVEKESYTEELKKKINDEMTKHQVIKEFIQFVYEELDSGRLKLNPSKSAFHKSSYNVVFKQFNEVNDIEVNESLLRFYEVYQKDLMDSNNNSKVLEQLYYQYIKNMVVLIQVGKYNYKKNYDTYTIRENEIHDFSYRTGIWLDELIPNRIKVSDERMDYVYQEYLKLKEQYDEMLAKAEFVLNSGQKIEDI